MTRAQEILYVVSEVMSPKLKRGLKWGAAAAGAAGAGYLTYKHGGDIMHHLKGSGGGGSSASKIAREIPYEHTPRGHSNYNDELNQLHKTHSGELKKSLSNISNLHNDHDDAVRGIEKTARHRSYMDSVKKMGDLDRSNGAIYKQMDAVRMKHSNALQQLPHREFAHYGM